MQHDTSGLDLARLAERIRYDYAIDLASLTYQPVGEDGYHYLGEGANGRRSFVRAQRLRPGASLSDLAAAYRAATRLQSLPGLGAIVAPLPSRRSDLIFRDGRYGVAVFPFVEGTTAFDAPVADSVWAEIATFFATLHRTPPTGIPIRARETFANPFEKPIQRSLAWARGRAKARNAYQQQVRELLLANQYDLEALRQMLALVHVAHRDVASSLVITHGDANLANIVVDAAGRIHVVDWGDLAFGPPERDLVSFAGPRFAAFLQAYRVAGGIVELRSEVVQFYCYRWIAQEIADYTTRILFDDVDSAQDAHAWNELQSYLPIPWERTAREIMEINRGG